MSNSIETQSLAPRKGLSQVCGLAPPPPLRVTIPQFLHDAVARFGERDTVVFCEPKITLSYREFGCAVGKIAAGLFALGLKKGDRIGIWAPNCIEWMLTQFATAQLGCILVNINPAYRPSELEFSLNKVGCQALVAAKCFKTSDYKTMIGGVAPEIHQCEPGQLDARKLPHLKSVVMIGGSEMAGVFSFNELRRIGQNVNAHQLERLTASLDPDDAINIQFTSGTTGKPKGATLSHYNIINNS